MLVGVDHPAPCGPGLSFLRLVTIPRPTDAEAQITNLRFSNIGFMSVAKPDQGSKLVCFSGSGFDDYLREAAADRTDVLLVDPGRLYR
jgi:hypothetical protein